MSAHATDLPLPRMAPNAPGRPDLSQFHEAPSHELVDSVDDDLEGVGPMPARARLGIPEGTQFHVLSFEGPDPYARIGGLETRVAGLCEALVQAGLETHLWFVGQPDLPGYECRDGLHLHRWCQWLS